MDDEARKRMKMWDEKILKWVNAKFGRNYNSVKEMHSDYSIFTVPNDVQTLAQLAGRLGSESERCRENGQLFSAAIIGASALEASLLTLCFAFEDRVVKTTAYTRHARSGKPYRDVVLRWDLDHLIRVAEELNWIPSEAISGVLKAAVEETYKDVWTDNEICVSESDLESFRAYLNNSIGSILLDFVREIRNLIHPGRWVRFDPGIENAERLAEMALALISEVLSALRYMTAELLKTLAVHGDETSAPPTRPSPA